jgi:hypothetical protein
MEATRFSEMSVLTRHSRRHIPEDCVLYWHAKSHEYSETCLSLQEQNSVHLWLSHGQRGTKRHTDGQRDRYNRHNDTHLFLSRPLSRYCYHIFHSRSLKHRKKALWWSSASVKGPAAYKKKSVTFSPQANYIDWSTATGRRILVPTFADRGVSRGQRGGIFTAVNLSLLDRSGYFSFK